MMLKVSAFQVEKHKILRTIKGTMPLMWHTKETQ